MTTTGSKHSHDTRRKERPPAGPQTPCDKRRILIVDDEKTILDLFSRILSLRLPNCRIDVAINGAEALHMFQDTHYGTIMMDLRMPVMDGQTAFLEIQKFCKSHNVEMPAVVFCTGYDPSNTVQKLIADNPAHCILRKPVSDKVLIETLRARLPPEVVGATA